jgi:hypothetical protein
LYKFDQPKTNFKSNRRFKLPNPHLNSQREHLLLGTIIESGSGSHLYSQRERLSLGTTIEAGSGSHLDSQRERLSLGTTIEAGSGSQSPIRNPQSPPNP